MITLAEFQEQSRRTMPFNGSPLFEKEGVEFLLNYSLGLVGEALELAKEVERYNRSIGEHKLRIGKEVIKEIGDVLHYLAGLYCYEGVKMVKAGDLHWGSETPHLTVAFLAGDLAEHAKKKVFHGHKVGYPWDLLNLLTLHLIDVADRVGSSLEECMQVNLDKLKTRYPEKFSTSDSVARVDV